VFQSAKKALESKSIGTLIVGGLLIGVGMQISGSCPGMVLVQLGAGVSWSYVTFIGALCGALAHGLIENMLKTRGDCSGSLIQAKALYEVARLPAVVVRVILIVLLGIIVFLMEFFIPWTNEYKDAVTEGSMNIFGYKAWPPYSKYIYLFRRTVICALFKHLP
jgi:hypothetical protein